MSRCVRDVSSHVEITRGVSCKGCIFGWSVSVWISKDYNEKKYIIKATGKK